MRKAMRVAPILVLAGGCMHPSLVNTPAEYTPHATLITSDANRLTLLGMYPGPLQTLYAMYNCPQGRMVIGPLGQNTSPCGAPRNVVPMSAPSFSREPSPTPPQAKPQSPISLPAVRPVQTTPGSARAGTR